MDIKACIFYACIDHLGQDKKMMTTMVVMCTSTLDHNVGDQARIALSKFFRLQ